MKIVIPGGTGHIGQGLAGWLRQRGHQVVIIGRNPVPGSGALPWDGRSLGAWAQAIDGCDAVINLAGRSVDCRYTEENMRQIRDSRVDSTRVVGLAIQKAAKPPAVWLQASSATIYSHRFDAANDEYTGEIAGQEPGIPAYWRTIIDVVTAWEKALADADTPRTRKVLLRTSLVMSRQAGSVFDVLSRLVRWQLGGPIAGGRQFVSWIHERDFARAIELLLERGDVAGPVNLAAPNPLPQRDFMSALRAAWGTRLGLPATRWMLAVGTFLLRTDSELMLKSRRVVPRRLLDAGFSFEFPDWPAAAADLARPA